MKIRDLDLDASAINLEHQQLGLPPLEHAITHPAEHPVLRLFGWLALLLLLGALFSLPRWVTVRPSRRRARGCTPHPHRCSWSAPTPSATAAARCGGVRS